MKTFTVTLAGFLTNSLLASATCYDYLLIDSRGTGEPQGESIGFKGMIADVLATLPNGARYDTVYPAAPDITQETTFIGSMDIENVIQQGLQSCPQQKYALLGYSQGKNIPRETAHSRTWTCHSTRRHGANKPHLCLALLKALIV